ncbi:uncharacterized protein LOC126744571 [Anthonomus grandis grandis]|uniref:uncharacterized protein LOC126744571 n=1 Tax=Anthonomus grandis grandis TaxID=2921223 RepID=UPI0021662089|nr:uncharacterized protein LOC126744571 [Anthonomus grandis grandis]
MALLAVIVGINLSYRETNLEKKEMEENNEDPEECVLGYGHSQNNLITSTSAGDDNNIIIVEESFDPHSITGILNICKKKLLIPYMRFLSLLGLRPIFGESTESRYFLKTFNVTYILQVIIFLVSGYVLQYMACFRRDRGFGSMSPIPFKNLNRTELKMVYDLTCSGSLISCFIIPSILHFAGYLCAYFAFRKTDDDQLTVLIERVFLTSSHVRNMNINQKQIVRTLWMFVLASFIWMFLSVALVFYMMAEGDIIFKWINHGPAWVEITMKTLLVICTICHDIIQASVISNYCLQVQLLKTYVQYMREMMLQQFLKPLDWIRSIEEFRKLLWYLNNRVASAVCLFTLVNGSYAISGTVWILASYYRKSFDSVPLYFAINVFNVMLWWIIAIAPFIQAARLNIACEYLKTVGQEVRARPYAHQETSVQELNSILIYTSSLKLNAKLFGLAIRGKYAGITLAIFVIFILVFGQSNFILTQ